MTGLRSSQVAEAVGVDRQTLRYYERRGLLAEPARTLGGHRLYPAEAVTRLRMIKAAQRLGFTLDEIADLLAAGGHRPGRPDAGLPDAGLPDAGLPDAGRPDAGLPERARLKLAEVESRIADLRVVASALRETIAAGCDDLVACAGRPGCPMIGPG